MSVICAGPREDAAIHHRDFQSDAEGIVVGQLAEDTITYGTAGVRKKDGPAVDTDTLFEIGSILAAYAAKLGKEGKLSGEWKQGPQPQPLTLTKSATRPVREGKK